MITAFTFCEPKSLSLVLLGTKNPWYNFSTWQCFDFIMLLLLHDQVGAYAVYMWRHKSYFGNARESLEHIGRVVILNMVLLCFSPPLFFLECFPSFLETVLHWNHKLIDVHLVLFSLCFCYYLPYSICNFSFDRVWVSFQGELITGVM